MRVLVVWAHPLADSFSAALFHRVCTALEAAGHEVDRLDLYRAGFEACLSRAEREAYHDIAADRTAVTGHIGRLQAAEGLVFVFPTWNFGAPAILKGWFERVLLPGVAFTVEGGTTRPRPAPHPALRLHHHLRRAPMGREAGGRRPQQNRLHARLPPADAAVGAGDMARALRYEFSRSGAPGSLPRSRRPQLRHLVTTLPALQEPAMRIHLVHAHPVPESFNAACRDAAVAALERAGHEIDLLDLYAEGFEPVLSAEERRVYHDIGPNVATVEDYVVRLRACDALVLVFPDLVVRHAGDPEGLVRPRLGAGGQLHPARGRRPDPARPDQHPQTGRRHLDRGAEVVSPDSTCASQ